MKTLNEVIEDLEKCMIDDAIESEGFYLATDSLFYLKEYRWIIENCANALAEKYPSENGPLTWDELKFMKGKPIWVEDNLETPEDIIKYWAIMQRIEKAEGDEYALLSDCYYDKSQYGKDWQAYRKERWNENTG